MAAIDEFLRVDGSGSGSGSGSGYGSGDGDGSGYGPGSGSGSGYGSGDGSGYGYGSGYGDGDGYGDGYGDGIKSINGNTVYDIDGVQTVVVKMRGNVLRGAILNSDLTTTPCYVVKGQNTFAHGNTLHEAMDALYDKLFDDMPAEQRIQEFLKVFEAGKTYPNKLFFDWHHRLTGSCMAGRESFARDHGIDVDNGSMTVDDFIKLTKGSYGGSVIKAVAEAYAAQ